MTANGNGIWARLRFYLSIGALIGVTTAGAFTIFETQAHHNTDVERILKNQESIIRRLDQLYFKESPSLTRPLYHYTPQPEMLIAS